MVRDAAGPVSQCLMRKLPNLPGGSSFGRGAAEAGCCQVTGCVVVGPSSQPGAVTRGRTPLGRCWRQIHPLRPWPGLWTDSKRVSCQRAGEFSPDGTAAAGEATRLQAQGLPRHNPTDDGHGRQDRTSERAGRREALLTIPRSAIGHFRIPRGAYWPGSAGLSTTAR